MNLVWVPRELAKPVWPQIENRVSKALARGLARFTAPDLLDSIQQGQRQLWLVLDGKAIKSICVTEILRYPLKRVCSIFLCTGEERDGWQHLIGEIETWARNEGCAAMEIWARPGWSRVLSNYHRSHVLLEREL